MAECQWEFPPNTASGSVHSGAIPYEPNDVTYDSVVHDGILDWAKDIPRRNHNNDSSSTTYTEDSYGSAPSLSETSSKGATERDQPSDEAGAAPASVLSDATLFKEQPPDEAGAAPASVLSDATLFKEQPPDEAGAAPASVLSDASATRPDKKTSHVTHDGVPTDIGLDLINENNVRFVVTTDTENPRKWAARYDDAPDKSTLQFLRDDNIGGTPIEYYRGPSPTRGIHLIYAIPVTVPSTLSGVSRPSAVVPPTPTEPNPVSNEVDWDATTSFSYSPLTTGNVKEFEKVVERISAELPDGDDPDTGTVIDSTPAEPGGDSTAMQEHEKNNVVVEVDTETGYKFLTLSPWIKERLGRLVLNPFDTLPERKHKFRVLVNYAGLLVTNLSKRFREAPAFGATSDTSAASNDKAVASVWPLVPWIDIVFGMLISYLVSDAFRHTPAEQYAAYQLKKDKSYFDMFREMMPTAKQMKAVLKTTTASLMVSICVIYFTILSSSDPAEPPNDNVTNTADNDTIPFPNPDIDYNNLLPSPLEEILFRLGLG